MRRHLLVIGNPGCRRVGFWQAAVTRLGWAGVDLLLHADILDNVPWSTTPGAVARIETAGGNWETFKLLLKHGAAPARSQGYPALDDEAIDRLECERGRLIHPRQAHLGFLRLLQIIEERLRLGGTITMQAPEEIALCFDKPSCQAHLARQGVPIPTCLGSPRSYDELRALARSERRVMVKLAHGSGAAGCVAIHYAQGRARGITTVAQLTVGGERRLYHSKRPCFLASETEVAALVDRLCLEGVHAEAWLPKARWQGRNIDLRIVTIAGVPRHTVVRSSTSVFTNLTLGSGRGDLAALVERMGPPAWRQVRDTCAAVAAAFPASFTLGIDVLIRPDWRRHQVLEVNAFGDLLLNQLDQGEDTYTAILKAWHRRHSTLYPGGEVRGERLEAAAS